mmetsp:Transcript_15956/g.49665  ORF Transcript_15956/g.49665 Transcript_15956/m.49665 type:complete len:297 (+) Transcript_15956:2676-3566(+)
MLDGADDELDAKHVFYIVPERRELLVLARQVAHEAIEIEDLVAHLVEDLLLRLDPRDHLVDLRLAVGLARVAQREHGGRHRRVVLDEGGDEVGRDPLAIRHHPVLREHAVPQREVRLGEERRRLHTLRQLEAMARAWQLADDDGLQVVAAEQTLAKQPAQRVLLLLALPQRRLELGARHLDLRAREAQLVRRVGLALDREARLVQVGNQVRDLLLLRDHVQRRVGHSRCRRRERLGRDWLPASTGHVRHPSRRRPWLLLARGGGRVRDGGAGARHPRGLHRPLDAQRAAEEQRGQP